MSILKKNKNNFKKFNEFDRGFHNDFVLFYLKNSLSKFLNKIELRNKKDIYIYLNKNNLLLAASFLKNDSFLNFKTLSDITVLDDLEGFLFNKDRFYIFYNLLSVSLNLRMFIVVNFDEKKENFLPSLTNLYKSANWLEREVWDMFGIFFSNHIDLRRILTDYGFDGFPLRKDFPLTGYIEVRYDDEYGCIVYEPVELSQSYRNFEFQSPWESY